MKRKILSIILCVVIIAGTLPLSLLTVQGEDLTQANVPISSDDISLTGTNAVGNMLAKEFEEEAEKQQSSGNVVTDVTVNGNEASVQLSTTVSCTLIVGIYTEDQKTMLTSSSVAVTPQDETATVTFSENLPEYFYIKAYLIETEDFAPVSAVYDSALYTEEMQTFLSKTTEDFEEEKVINFDNDETTNYAVLSDNVTRLDETGDKNELISADYESDVYVFQNADEQLKNAKPNDIITNEYGDDFVIIKVASVSVSGNTVTVTGKQIDLEEVFDYLRVEETAGGIDAAELQRLAAENTDNVMQYQPEPAPKKAPLKASGEVTHGGSATFTFTEKNLLNRQTGKFDCNIKFSGSLNFKVEAKVSFYITLTYYDVSVKIDYSADVTIGVSGSIKGYIGMPVIPLVTTGVVNIQIVPGFTPEFSGEIDFTGKLKGTFGFKKTSDTDCQNLSSAPKLESEIKGEVKVFLGFELMPTVTFISKKICYVGIPVTIGLEGKATLSYNTSDFLSESIHHDCISCLKGEIYGKLDISIEGEFLKNDKWKFKKTIVGVKVKVWDFYWSLDYKEFGFTTCPHISYKLTVNVTDENGKAMKDATVNFNNKNYSTDNNGSVSAFLKNGNYTVTVTAKDYKTANKSITVKDASKTLNIKLSKEGSGSGGTTTNPDFKISTLSLDAYYTGALTENGDLYMWGDNYYGQIGDGTTTTCKTPKKILSNVKSVSLGDYHTGAITENGDLYMWGSNYDGKIGDGTYNSCLTPKKILSNVKSVSLGYCHTGALTENGDLYMWGSNYDGEIGDGTKTDRLTPKKILSNVKSVSLGNLHTGAITENGDLYMWGRNFYGQIGDGTTTNRTTPKKILSNVKSVSLGGSHTGAVTENGDLYMWGYNCYGQTGDGTKTDRLTPKKILSNVKSVSLGDLHSGAITENGDLYMWGHNSCGQIGDGTTTDCLTPKKILSNVKSVGLGNYHTGAITENGDLYMWGRNGHGQIGDGTTTDRTTPTKITLPTAVKLSAPLKSAKLFSAEPESQSSFEGLTPNTVYNFYIMKDKKSETPFKTDNLFYIDQGITDKDGNITFNYAPQEIYSSAQKFVVAFENRLPDDIFENEVITADKDTVYLHINNAKFDDYGFENIRAEFNINGVSAVSSNVTVSENDYVIAYKPQGGLLETDNITATVLADYENSIYTAKAFTIKVEDARCDINKDGFVNVYDITYLRQILLGIYNISPDANGDGFTNLSDLVHLKKYFVK